MTPRKVVAAYQETGADGRHYPVSVTDDGQHWLYDGSDRTWVRISLPLPPEALGEVAGEATDEPPAPDLGEWPGRPDAPPDTSRDVEILTPHGACVGGHMGSSLKWRVTVAPFDYAYIDSRDVIAWRDMPRAVVEDGRVTGVRRG